MIASFLRRLSLALVTVGFGLAVACGGGDDAGNEQTGQNTPPTQQGAASTIGAAGSQPPVGSIASEGEARVTADGVETVLSIDDCVILDSAVAVTATSASENASLNVVGLPSNATAGVATIGFSRSGDQWTAAGALIEIAGSSIRFSGTALKTSASPPESQLLIEVTCH